MARYVFFSFAYGDVKNFKVNVVRNSWLLSNRDSTFIDGSIWESSKLSGDEIKTLISGGLKKTSVTVVLIGEGTADRRWVNYEIVKSFDKGNGILGVHINRVKGKVGLTPRGPNPLERNGFQISEDGRKVRFYELVNRRWRPNNDLAVINNKKSNSIYFEDGLFFNDFGKFFRFSDKFKSYCWVNNNGHTEFASWVDDAADDVGR